jgi:NADH-quinone oxidoreductase subunit C
MDEKLLTITQALAEQWPVETREFRGDVTLIVPAESIIPVLKLLKGEFEFNMLMDITGVDYYPQQEPRFHVVYQLFAMDTRMRLTLRVPLSGNAPEMPSAIPVFVNANWKEREVWDMFGVRFTGHPDLRRILLPYEWEGHPLRKDYPLGYEEPEFSFNIEEIEKRKPYAKGIR